MITAEIEDESGGDFHLQSFSPVEEKVLEIQKLFVYKRKTLDFDEFFSWRRKNLYKLYIACCCAVILKL